MENMSNTSVAEPVSVDLDFASACMEAVGKVLEISTATKATYMNNNQPDGPPEAKGFQGKISLSGDWRGEIIVAVPYSLGAQLSARFVGCDESELKDKCIGEGVSEIANQIAGRMSTMLSREGHLVKISVPTLRKSPEWYLPPSESHTVFRFECIEQPFLLIVKAVADE
jgi:CheY-specific phosphatase CheX